MLRVFLVGLAAALTLSIGLAVGARDKGQTVSLDGTTFVVDHWNNNPNPKQAGFSVKSPAGSRPWAWINIYGSGSWEVSWQNIPRSRAGSSCADEERWVRALAREAGLIVANFKTDDCKKYSGFFEALSTSGTAQFTRTGVQPVAVQQCTPYAYLGTWQRPGSGKQNPQVQLVFTRKGDKGIAQARGFARAPYSENENVVVAINGQGDACRFRAACNTRSSTPNPCTVVVNPANNTLVVEGGAQYFVSDVPWTRVAAAPAATCTKSDIEGDWHRSDGALVPIVGVDAGMRDGGTALLFGHPDNWPRGQSKFRGIFRVGGADSCKLKAVCAGYTRNSSTGQFTRNERACELTIDPLRQTMRESGNTLGYSRKGKATAGSQGVTPPASLPVTSAQELAEIATRERLNREQAAFAAKQVADNAAAKAAFDKATADRAATIAAQKAEQQRKEREYQAAMAKWRADVEACQKGDISRCGTQP